MCGVHDPAPVLHGRRWDVALIQVTMMRTLGLLCSAAALVLCDVAAGAQTRASSEPVTCPRGRLSIYFASGDVNASPQAQLLIGRIGDTASTCNPDGVDLVARIDAAVDGERAVSIALARLGKVADDLVAMGVPAGRIRIAAQSAGSVAAPGLNQIDVVFHKAGAPEIEVNPTPAVPPARTVRSDAI